MRNLSTLATLLLGLAVVFWAPAAKAHCPHANHPDPEHCSVEPPLGPSPNILSAHPDDSGNILISGENLVLIDGTDIDPVITLGGHGGGRVGSS